MLIAGSFLTLIYFVVFKWLAMEKKRTDYQGSVNGWLAPLAQLSILGFLAAIGTIDGAGYPDIHSIGAVFFFIVLFLVVVISTIVLRDMHLWDSTVLSRTSYVTKAGLTLYLVLLMTYCLYGLATEGEQNDDDKYVVIM